MLVTSPLLEPLRQMFRRTSSTHALIGDLKADPEAPFRAIVEDLSDPLVVLDPDGVILYANTAWRDIRSISLEETLGRNITEMGSTPQRKAMAESRREILRELTPENRSMMLAFALRDDKHVEVVYRGWFDEANELIAVSALARDCTEAYFYEQELKAANAALAESNRDLQDFAHIASHDLQEPLRKISAFTERLGDKYADQLDDRGQDYLARISSASGRMQQLIHSLLEFSRVNSRAGAMLEVDLDEVVASVLSDLEVAIEESGATICLEELPTILCDATQMRQLFQNLIGNALKFRKPDELPRISVHSETDEDGHAIIISDNGIGFDQDFADKIFAPFQRLHARTDYAGSGIGLSVCRRIVERHGGQITATSTPGEGATFTIDF